MTSVHSFPDERQLPQRLGDRCWWGALLGGIGGILGTTLGGATRGLGLLGLGCGLIGVGLVPGAILGMLVNVALGAFLRKETARWTAFFTGASVGAAIAIWLSTVLQSMGT